MEFNNLFNNPLDCSRMLLMRHSPPEPDLKRVLPWLAADRHDLYNAYQQTHGKSSERQLLRADTVASFIGHEPGKALYVGHYRVTGNRPLTYDEYWALPAYKKLRQWDFRGLTQDQGSCLWFDLEPTDFYQHWKGKLVINWPSGRPWSRWADKNKLEIHAIHEESLLDPPLKDWTELNLKWDDLSILPKRLRNRLSEWRGIYYIFDEQNAKGYVGSACGGENILGRWITYAASGHGGNAQLKKLNPKNFRFSILQRVSPDMDKMEIISLEKSWKERLHTRLHGLNDN